MQPSTTHNIVLWKKKTKTSLLSNLADFSITITHFNHSSISLFRSSFSFLCTSSNNKSSPAVGTEATYTVGGRAAVECLRMWSQIALMLYRVCCGVMVLVLFGMDGLRQEFVIGGKGCWSETYRASSAPTMRMKMSAELTLRGVKVVRRRVGLGVCFWGEERFVKAVSSK